MMVNILSMLHLVLQGDGSQREVALSLMETLLNDCLMHSEGDWKEFCILFGWCHRDHETLFLMSFDFNVNICELPADWQMKKPVQKFILGMRNAMYFLYKLFDVVAPLILVSRTALSSRN